MTNPDFVPYNESLKLKELGFDEPCFGFWDAYNGDTHLFFKQRGDYHWLLKLFGQTPKPVLEITNWEIECLEGDGTVLAPTSSQAINFLYICSNKQINIELKASDTYEERVRKVAQGCEDLRNLQNSKSN